MGSTDDIDVDREMTDVSHSSGRRAIAQRGSVPPWCFPRPDEVAEFASLRARIREAEERVIKRSEQDAAKESDSV